MANAIGKEEHKSRSEYCCEGNPQGSARHEHSRKHPKCYRLCHVSLSLSACPSGHKKHYGRTATKSN